MFSRAVQYCLIVLIFAIMGIRCDSPASPIVDLSIGVWQFTNGPHGGTILSTFIDSHGQLFSGTLESGSFRSDDNGNNWYKLSINRTTSIIAFAEHPSKGLFAVAYTGEVFLSRDQGRTWTQTESPQAGNCYSLAFASSGDLYAGTTSGLYVSPDGGNSWNKLAPSVIILANQVVVDTQDRILVAMPCPGILRSTDHGQSWSFANNGLSDPCIQLLYLASTGLVYTASVTTLYRSSDFGDHWSPLSGFNGYIISVAQTSSGSLLVGTDRGLWRSSDDGQTWNSTSGPVEHLLSQGNRVIAASGGYYQSDAVFFSQDTGSTWNRVGLPVTNIISFVTTATGKQYAVAKESGLFAFEPSNLRWTYRGLGPDITSASLSRSGSVLVGFSWGTIAQYSPTGEWSFTFITSGSGPITALLDSRSGALFAGTAGSGLYVRSQVGGIWNHIGQDIRGDVIHTIKEDAQGYLYVGTNLGLCGSSNPLSSWEQLTDLYTDVKAVLLAVDGSVFIGTSGRGVMRSRGPSQPWTAVNNGISELDVNAIVEAQPGILYVATSANVYESTNHGGQWSTVGTGLEGHTLTSLTVLSDGRLLAGTLGEGCMIIRIH